MYEFQNSLPRFALPSLEKTCSRYLKIVAPLLSETELARTKAAVMAFQQGKGIELQRQLEMLVRANEDSCIYNKLIEEGVLENRRPLQLEMNAASVLSPIPATSKLPLTRLVATWIYDTLDFYLKVKHRQLKPDLDTYRKGYNPLCMIQYDNLFGTSRIPGIKSDHMWRTTDGKHIVVTYRNVFYSLMGIQGEESVTISELEQQLNWILEHTSFGEPPIGVLTALPRTKWAVIRSYLGAIAPENAQSLKLLDNALFIVCLDETIPIDLKAACQNALHADGQNRWFDKPLQLIFTPDGQAALKTEHTGFDGYTVMRFVAEINQQRQHLGEPPAFTSVVKGESPVQLKWSLTQELLDEIQQAKVFVDNLIAQQDIQVLEFKEFGGKFIQQHNLIADAVVLLAIQLAYARLHGKVACISETIHLRHFQSGRWEDVRVVTPESIDLTRVFTESTSDEIRYSALKRATMAHLFRLYDSKQGQGVEWPLFVLHTLARHQGEVPEIFQDKAYTEVFCQQMVVTTSLASSKGIILSCFGPAAEGSYAVYYSIEPDSIAFSVTSKNWQTGQFVKLLKQILLEFRQIITS